MSNDLETADPPTILIIDDDAVFLRSLKLLLEVAGYTVATAENGVRGLQAFRNRDPDVVLIDIMMPRLDGMETIRQMRRERPNATIIAMSGGSHVGDLDFRTAARQLGAVAALEKPFEAVALKALLRGLVQQDNLEPVDLQPH